MTISQIRKLLKISNSWIAKHSGYASVKSYNKSAGKKKIENLIIELYKKFNENK